MTNVKVIPSSGAVIVKKGMSVRSGFRAFGYGTMLGGAAGFLAGFTLAQAVYSDEREREQVKRTLKVAGVACAGACVVGAIGSVLARR